MKTHPDAHKEELTQRNTTSEELGTAQPQVFIIIIIMTNFS